MRHCFARFRADEDGAVTVDWVVLTAAIIALCLGIVTIIISAGTDPATSLAAWLGNYEVLGPPDQ